MFVAGLAWIPFWYGSNDLMAWGVNAVLFPSLAVMYEISILAQRKSHPVGIKEFWLSAALFVAVVLWIIVQNAAWTPGSWHHPIWAISSDALERPVAGSISVAPDLTTLGLVRLITAASVFWIAVQLCRSPARADRLITAVVTISCAYAAYALVLVGLQRGFATSTFINRNHFATYAGVGLVTACGLIFKLYRDEVTTKGGSLRFRIASILEVTSHKGALLLSGAFLILVAVLLTGSRAGITSTVLGLFVLAVLTFRRDTKNFAGQREILIFLGLLLAAVFLAFGDIFFGKIIDSSALGGRGLYDENRMAVYLITLRSIFDSPWLGYGYGTFADVFPMFRDRSISVQGVWEHAHNTYLEVLQGLGLVFGSMLVACVVILAWRCRKGATERLEGVTVPRIATSVSCLVGAHALADFSLEMQGVTLTFMALLGTGVAQSKSSRLALND